MSQGRIQDFGLKQAGSLGVQGQRTGEGLGAKPPEARRMLRNEDEKPLTNREKQICTD